MDRARSPDDTEPNVATGPKMSEFASLRRQAKTAIAMAQAAVPAAEAAATYGMDSCAAAKTSAGATTRAHAV